MIPTPSRILLWTAPADFRNSIDGLAALVELQLRESPLSAATGRWGCQGTPPLAIAAARAIGLRAEPTDAGYRLLEGGRMPQLPAEAPGASATGAAELHVWATPGVPRDPWFADKISAVRWHGVQATEGAGCGWRRSGSGGGSRALTRPG